MNDPRVKAIMPKKPLFDMKRMLYSGFKTILKRYGAGGSFLSTKFLTIGP